MMRRESKIQTTFLMLGNTWEDAFRALPMLLCEAAHREIIFPVPQMALGSLPHCSRTCCDKTVFLRSLFGLQEFKAPFASCRVGGRGRKIILNSLSSLLFLEFQYSKIRGHETFLFLVVERGVGVDAAHLRIGEWEERRDRF